MKATELLAAQHRRIQGLTGDLTKPMQEERIRRPMLVALVDELIAHMAIEQRMFYPCAQRALDIDLAPHRDTHRRARAALLRLADPNLDRVLFEDEASKLRAIVEEHVALEDDALFVRVELVTDAYALDSLGERMRAFHAAILHADQKRALDGPAKVDAAPRSIASVLSMASVQTAGGGSGRPS